MKKALILIMAVFMLIAMWGCGRDKTESQYFEKNGYQYFRCAGCDGGFGIHLIHEVVDGKAYCYSCSKGW